MIKIYCRRCGFILGVLNGSKALSVDDILRRWGYRCPRCLRQLPTRPVEIILRPRKKWKKKMREERIRV